MSLFRRKPVTQAPAPKGGVRRVVPVTPPSPAPIADPTVEPTGPRAAPAVTFAQVTGLLGSRRFHYTLIGFSFVALLGAGAYLAVTYLFSSPHFAIKKVEFSPTVHVERSELVRLAGLKPGINIFRLSPGHIARRLKRHPWIRSASVSRILPDKLRIRVTEREARGAVLFTQKSGRCAPGQPCRETPFYLVDEQGEVFKRAEPAELEGKIIITGLLRSQYIGDPHGTGRRLKRALTLFDSYRSNPARPELSELFLQGDIVTLFMKKSGTAVHFDIQRFDSLVGTFDSFLGGVSQKLDQFSEVYMDNRENPDRIVCIPHHPPETPAGSAPEKAPGDKKNVQSEGPERLTASKHAASKKTKPLRNVMNSSPMTSPRSRRALHIPRRQRKTQVSSIR